MPDESPRLSREAALFLIWMRLQEHEAEHPDQPYATVLDMRSARKKARIEELAREYGEKVGSPLSPDKFRRLLQGARNKFLELLTELGHGRA